MTAEQMSKLIQLEVDDLASNIHNYESEKKKLDGLRPAQGDGSVYETDAYGTYKCITPGLQQGATVTAIDRKIITIREHLITLRKLVL